MASMERCWLIFQYEYDPKYNAVKAHLERKITQWNTFSGWIDIPKPDLSIATPKDYLKFKLN